MPERTELHVAGGDRVLGHVREDGRSAGRLRPASTQLGQCALRELDRRARAARRVRRLAARCQAAHNHLRELLVRDGRLLRRARRGERAVARLRVDHVARPVREHAMPAVARWHSHARADCQRQRILVPREQST